MPRKVSADLKARIPTLSLDLHFNVKAICRILGVKKSLVYNTLHLYQTTGCTTNAPTFCHYLDEIQSELLNQRGVKVSIATILRALHRLHFTHKSISVQALERNDLDRSAFMNCIAEIAPDPSMYMFIDEAAKNDKTVERTMGWSLILITNPYPGPRSVLILDNCSIHHAEAIRELVEDQAGKSFPVYQPLF
ncbi:hypothetical protein C8J56DRAFT_1039895 [Mycena floridula]|nr:hypothetical protein C8J56DRAFT_1039895 [Mycena floridula]